MASMREHMQKVHEAASSHHGEMAKSHAQLAKCYGSMSKAAGSDDGKMYQSIADQHDQMSKSHQAASDFHGECADECMKSESDRLGKTLVPDRISSVASVDTPNFGIRAIPRAGAPMIDATVDKANVPIQFRHLLHEEEA